MILQVIGCAGAYPHGGSPTSGYLLKIENQNMLLDCGSGVLLELSKSMKIEDVDCLFITHYHEDHCADLGPLVFAKNIHQKPMTIYAPWEPTLSIPIDPKGPITFVPMFENQQYSIPHAHVSFLQNPHPIETYSMKVTYGDKTFVYTSDTIYNEKLISFCKDADLLLIECSGYEDESAGEFGHLNAKEVKDIITQAKTKINILTHLPFRGNPEDLLKSFKDVKHQKVILAKPGLVVPV